MEPVGLYNRYRQGAQKGAFMDTERGAKIWVIRWWIGNDIRLWRPAQGWDRMRPAFQPRYRLPSCV